MRDASPRDGRWWNEQTVTPKPAAVIAATGSLVVARRVCAPSTGG
jgi:hypothetical protein